MSDKTKNIGGRSLTSKLKTAKGRKISSTNWLSRQLNDPYVQKAKREGYLSRAAYKLLEIDEKFSLIKSNSIIIDLGAAPGGWTQVALKKIKLSRGGKIIAIDINPMNEIKDAIIITQDFLSIEAEEMIKSHMNGRKADLIMSDMAAPSSGHTQTDHLKIIYLCEMAFEFAKNNLNDNGSFIAKILKGGTENTLLAEMKKFFKVVKHFKPPASRAESAESYVVATGFHE